MSNSVRKIAGLGLAALGVFVSVISFGVALPVGLKMVVAGAALYSSGKKPKRPGVAASFGTEVQLSGDPNAVRPIVYGEKWTAGDLRYRQSAGTDNTDFYMVIILAGHEIDSVSAVMADRQTLTLDGSGNVTAPSQWVGLMNVRFYSGTDSQTADATLMSEVGLTSNHRFRGLAYAIVKLTFNEETLNTPPPFRFKVKGRKVYDPRLDSTNGGSGSHRLATPSTWAWSRNTVLCQNDYDRGIYINGKRVAGRGIASTRFDWANVIAEANICEEAVDLDAGGDQERYTCDGIIDPSMTHGDNIRMFEGAYAGDSLPSDGKWRYFVGAYRTPTLHLQDQHFVGPLRHQVHRGEAARYDTAQGVYAAMAEAGTAIPYHPVVLGSATTGEEKIFDLDLQLVSDVTNVADTYDGGARAQRIAKLLLQKEVAGKTINLTANLYGYRAVPGETILITRSSFGLSSQAMRVLDVQLRPVEQGGKVGLVTDLVLEAGPADLYEWDAEETAIAASPALIQAQVPFDLPMGPWTPILVNVTRVGSRFTKTGGTDATWDSSFYSQEGYVACQVSWRASQTNKACMVGLNSDPTTNSNYTSLDFAVYMQSGGTLDIYESAVSLGLSIAYSTSDQLSIEYDGLRIRYRKNGTIIRTVPLIGARLFTDSSFFDSGAAVNSVSFGPITHVLAGSVGWASDSQGKPSGLRLVESTGIALDRATLSLSGSAVKISPGSTSNGAGFGVAAIPVDPNETYDLYVRHRSSGSSADGNYIRFFESSAILASGNTHIGKSASAESCVEDHDTYQDALTNVAMPGTTAVEAPYSYTPTAGTKLMTLAFYNYAPASNVDYFVEWAALVKRGTNIDLLPGVLPPVDTFGLNPEAASAPYTVFHGFPVVDTSSTTIADLSVKLFTEQNSSRTYSPANVVPDWTSNTSAVPLSDVFDLIAGFDVTIGYALFEAGVYIGDYDTITAIPAPLDDFHSIAVSVAVAGGFQEYQFDIFTRYSAALYTTLQGVMFKR